MSNVLKLPVHDKVYIAQMKLTDTGSILQTRVRANNQASALRGFARFADVDDVKELPYFEMKEYHKGECTYTMEHTNSATEEEDTSDESKPSRLYTLKTG